MDTTVEKIFNFEKDIACIQDQTKILRAQLWIRHATLKMASLKIKSTFPGLDSSVASVSSCQIPFLIFNFRKRCFTISGLLNIDMSCKIISIIIHNLSFLYILFTSCCIMYFFTLNPYLIIFNIYKLNNKNLQRLENYIFKIVILKTMCELFLKKDKNKW